MDILTLLLQRPVIITLALSGAAIATLGNVFLRKSDKVSPKTARLITRFGYGISWVSVALFIAAGFFGPQPD